MIVGVVFLPALIDFLEVVDTAAIVLDTAANGFIKHHHWQMKKAQMKKAQVKKKTNEKAPPNHTRV